MGKVIGIMSFKGGVGKTTASINLASALNKFGKEVLIIDGNFKSPNLHFYLGLLNPQRTLKEIIREDISPENAIYEHKSGIHMIPSNFYNKVDLRKFKKIVDNLREKYDYIILDSGPSYTEEIIAILMVSDELIFIATPDYPTLAATIKAAKFTQYKNMKVRGIIINRIKKKRFELKRSEVEKTVNIPVIGEIAEDNKLLKSVRKFSPVVYSSPRSKSSRAYLKLARKILESN